MERSSRFAMGSGLQRSVLSRPFKYRPKWIARERSRVTWICGTKSKRPVSDLCLANRIQRNFWAFSVNRSAVGINQRIIRPGAAQFSAGLFSSMQLTLVTHESRWVGGDGKGQDISPALLIASDGSTAAVGRSLNAVTGLPPVSWRW